MTEDFHKDQFAREWMDWRQNIESGEITINLAAIPEVERELTAKYKALAASTSAGTHALAIPPEEHNVFVQYAVAIIMGRHIDYVRMIWRSLVCLMMAKVVASNSLINSMAASMSTRLL